MEVLDSADIPLDHRYYRSSSSIYERYMKTLGFKIIKVGDQYGWMRDLIPGFLQIAKFERVRNEPNINILKKNGFRHGLIIWNPYDDKYISSSWWKGFFSSFCATGFSIIDRDNYFEKWNSRAKRSRKSFLMNTDLFIKIVPNDVFKKVYEDTDIKYPHKESYQKHYNKITSVDEEGCIVNFLCYMGENVLGGLSVVNYDDKSSMHLISFITEQGKPLHVGTGLVDYWYKYSLERGVKYINFDHMKDALMGKSHKGYSDFKKNFIDYFIEFKKTYFMIR